MFFPKSIKKTRNPIVRAYTLSRSMKKIKWMCLIQTSWNMSPKNVLEIPEDIDT
jgi:hypothetical protein